MNVTAAVALVGCKMQSNNRTPRINSDDLDHMNAFPADRREKFLEWIMSCLPETNTEFTGNNQYEKMILTLRRDDLGVSEILCVRRGETFSRRLKMFTTYRQTQWKSQFLSYTIPFVNRSS